MPPRKPTPADILTLIAERAESLRRAGVLAVQVDNFSVQLAPYSEPDPVADRPGPVEVEMHSDPLRDPATYADGRVPGFTREEDPS